VALVGKRARQIFALSASVAMTSAEIAFPPLRILFTKLLRLVTASTQLPIPASTSPATKLMQHGTIAFLIS
jgi:hypothetical protein